MAEMGVACGATLTVPSLAGDEKLGHPVPESNLALDEKSGAPQHAQLNIPGRFSLLSGLEKGRSVPC